MINTYSEALSKVISELTIFGLTGFTGSGCSKTARLLSLSRKPRLSVFHPISSDRFQNEICRLQEERFSRLWNKVIWCSFENIEVSKIIFSLDLYAVVCLGAEDVLISDFLKKYNDEGGLMDLCENLKSLSFMMSDVEISKENGSVLIEAYEISKNLFRFFKNQSELGEFICRMQDHGDNVRLYGTSIPKSENKEMPKNLFVMPRAIEKLILAYKICEDRSCFVVDAFRNPYEVEYFKRKYSGFYLVAINRSPEKRKNSLLTAGLSEGFIDGLEKRELGKSRFDDEKKRAASQNISECLRKSDVYMDNMENPKGKENLDLERQVARLVALVKYPGYLEPTTDERNMQIAMTARQASGCISRRVGAVVVDEDGYIAGIGWNDPPVGQIPCSLRTVSDLENDAEGDVFSDYEKTEKFKNSVVKRFENKKIDKSKPFCFRDELFYIEKENDGCVGKKAEMTRSLHAEENAFLQANRTTGEILGGGTLYTTDRTCNLCAKKSYQLRINRIVYVEDYTDIAIDQTISSGFLRPKIERFKGVLGAAFFKLFSNVMPEKDLIVLDSLDV